MTGLAAHHIQVRVARTSIELTVLDLGFRGFNLVPAAGHERAVAEQLLPLLRDNS